jgi:hypothetical protein
MRARLPPDVSSRRLAYACALFVAAGGSASASKPTRFWNLTDNTVTAFALAPAGTENYGPDQAKADKDGSVDHDERLKISNVPTGRYDAKLVDAKGRKCTAKDIAITAGEVFSIEEKQITCAP